MEPFEKAWIRIIESSSRFMVFLIQYADLKWNIVFELYDRDMTIFAPREIMSQASGLLVDGLTFDLEDTTDEIEDSDE